EGDALDQAGQGLWLRLGRGEREGTGIGRRAALTAGLHGAPNLPRRARFDKRRVLWNRAAARASGAQARRSQCVAPMGAAASASARNDSTGALLGVDPIDEGAQR